MKSNTGLNLLGDANANLLNNQGSRGFVSQAGVYHLPKEVKLELVPGVSSTAFYFKIKSNGELA